MTLNSSSYVNWYLAWQTFKEACFEQERGWQSFGGVIFTSQHTVEGYGRWSSPERRKLALGFCQNLVNSLMGNGCFYMNNVLFLFLFLIGWCFIVLIIYSEAWNEILSSETETLWKIVMDGDWFYSFPLEFKRTSVWCLITMAFTMVNNSVFLMNQKTSTWH